jgi:magnesium chelatase accessory protein
MAPARDVAPPAAWATEGRDWPLRSHSRFIEADRLRWHVQVLGHGPVLFMVHGTGASTHSYRGMAPQLARHFTVVMPDLPGHGFTDLPASHRLTLPGMARSLDALLRSQSWQPVLAVGHSAGVAILARMCLDGRIAPAALVALNAAVLPLGGVAGRVFSPLAKLLVLNPLVPRLFSWRAGNPAVVDQLLQSTGSTLDAEGKALYGRLVRRPSHATGALGMMAQWDLRPLARDLPKLATPLLVVCGNRDRTIPPADQTRLAALVPGARLITLAGLGHLAHEEQPDAVAAIIEDAAPAQRLAS